MLSHKKKIGAISYILSKTHNEELFPKYFILSCQNFICNFYSRIKTHWQIFLCRNWKVAFVKNLKTV